MREPTLEGFGRKLVVKAGLMVVGSLIVAAYSSRGLPTEGLDTQVPARPKTSQAETAAAPGVAPSLPDAPPAVAPVQAQP